MTRRFNARRASEELDQEIRAYVDLAIEEKVAAGCDPAEARRQVLLETGGMEQVKQAVRDSKPEWTGAKLWRDLRFGCRRLRREPGYVAAVILTLALAIGANTAVFSVLSALELRPLPYPQPARLGTIFTHISGAGETDERHHIDGEQWELLRDQVPALVSAASSGTSGVNLKAGPVVQYVQEQRVSAHFFDVLGVPPLLGRGFTATEDLPHGAAAVVLSHVVWQNSFHGDEHVLGRTLLLKGRPYTVVGVLAAGVVTPSNADLYTPLQASREGEGSGTNFDDIVRLRKGTDWSAASAQITRAWNQRARPYELQGNPGAKVSYHVVPLQQGQAAAVRPQITALMLASGLILLIACANLAGLNLVRMLRRAPEIGTQIALGASRWRIQRQLWVENLVVAGLGGVCGVGVGVVANRGLLALLPEHLLPAVPITLDLRVLAFAAMVTLFSSVLFGMLPTLSLRGSDLSQLMNARAVTSKGRAGVREFLITAEIALTVVLLASSGLLLRTLVHLQTLPPGFQPHGVFAGKVSLNDAKYADPLQVERLFRNSLDGMQRIPGVSAAAVGLSLPYERALNIGFVFSDGAQTGKSGYADEVYVTPDYFRVLEMPLREGRSFTEEDGPAAQHVAIVNRRFAERFFPGDDPVGRMLNHDMRIVGVVEDVALAPGIDSTAPLDREETMYVPAAQMNTKTLALVHAWFQPSWIVKTNQPDSRLAPAMQEALKKVDSDLPFSGFYSMTDLLATLLAMQRVEVTLLGTMAFLALFLSGTGVLALVATLVTQRTKEIGIRLALGATLRTTMLQVSKTAVRAALLGIGFGVVLSGFVLQGLRGALYGVTLYDGPTVLAVIVVLTCTVFLAALLPTLRIAGIDPARTLREP